MLAKRTMALSAFMISGIDLFDAILASLLIFGHVVVGADMDHAGAQQARVDKAAADELEPGCFLIRSLSPVSRLSFTSASPETTTASAGI